MMVEYVDYEIVRMVASVALVVCSGALLLGLAIAVGDYLKRKKVREDNMEKIVVKKWQMPYHNTAQANDDGFRARHGRKVRKALGVWRWNGIMDESPLLLALLATAHAMGRKVVDLGGAAAPLGFGSIIVDTADHTINAQAVKYHSMKDLDFKPWLVFSSHTLEHFLDVENALFEIKKVMQPNGQLVLHLPAWTCARWLPGEHADPNFGDHKWIFSLGDHPPGTRNCLNIVECLARVGFGVQAADYVGDNSILVVALNGEV